MPLKEQAPPPASGIKLDDIYYSLFRYKWLILVLSLAGIGIASTIIFLSSPLYQSQAKLLIRFVIENRSPSPIADSSAQIRTPDVGGESIINSEIEILTSLDLAKQVVEELRPETILAKVGGGNNPTAAASVILQGLQAEAQRRSTVIHVSFQHPDSAIVQRVLTSLLTHYVNKHLEIHRGMGILDEYVTRSTDQLRRQLDETENELRQIKSKTGAISVDEMKKSLLVETFKIRELLIEAEADLAECKVATAEMENLTPTQNESAASSLGVSLVKLNDYKTLCAQLNTLLGQQREMLAKYTEENPVVQRHQQQISRIQAEKKQLETEFPKLKDLEISSLGTSKTIDPYPNVARVKALTAKIASLNGQLKRIQTEAGELDAAEPRIMQLQRKKELEEASYKQFIISQQKTLLEDPVGAGKNINQIQTPSPPAPATSKVFKAVGMAVGGGVGAGVGLAMLLGLVLNQSVKRPSELETRFRIPLFLTIPDKFWKRLSKPSSSSGRSAARLAGTEGSLNLTGPVLASRRRKESRKSSINSVMPEPSFAAVSAAVESAELPARSESQDALYSYYEALRDRLITFFEVRNMTRKPKLIAVTSCHHGAGVTSVAAGLSAALSEVGGSKVLLVDMDPEHGLTHPFWKRKPLCGLPELLELENQEVALVQDNLYLASAAKNNGQVHSAMPKQFSQLVPKLQSSHYDYIIFDTPSIMPTSITYRLAAFMDVTVLVVEAEKTHRGTLRRALALLSESNSNVGTVLNKTRNYIPAWLHQEM